jgi:hypothetical protein
MGIYCGDKIYGVRILDPENILYENSFQYGMTNDEKEVIKIVYRGFYISNRDDVVSENPKNIIILALVEMTTTYDYPPRTDRVWIRWTELMEEIKDKKD